MEERNKKILEIIAINVRNARFRLKISQEQLAEMTGLSVNFVSNLENAKQDVRICSLNAVADALNMSLKDFVK